MSNEKPWLNADIGVSAPTKLTPIDWQARCLRLEAELAALRDTMNLREACGHKSIKTIEINGEFECAECLAHELTLIKGRQEWGTQSVFGTSARESEADAVQAVAQYPTRLRLFYRYSCGPWVPVAKEGE